MYYYKKRENDVIKYEVECTDRKSFVEEFGLFGNTLSPVVFAQVVDYINGDDSVVQDLLSSEELDQHNYKKSFEEVEVARIPFDLYRRFLQFIGKKDAPININDANSLVWSNEQVCYMSKGNVYKKVRIKTSSEALHEIIQKMYLRYGDKGPEVLNLLERLETGDYKVVPYVLNAIDSVKEKISSAVSEEDEINAKREYKFLYAPILNALRVKELVSITRDEFEDASAFLGIGGPLIEKGQELEAKKEIVVNIEKISDDAIKYVFGEETDRFVSLLFIAGFTGKKRIIAERLVFMLEEIKRDLENDNIKSAEDWLIKYNDEVQSHSYIKKTLKLEELKKLYNTSKVDSKAEGHTKHDGLEPEDVKKADTDRLVSIAKEKFKSQKDGDKSMIAYWSGVMQSLESEDRYFVLQLIYLMYAIENANNKLDMPSSESYQAILDNQIAERKNKELQAL